MGPDRGITGYWNRKQLIKNHIMFDSFYRPEYHNISNTTSFLYPMSIMPCSRYIRYYLSFYLQISVGSHLIHIPYRHRFLGIFRNTPDEVRHTLLTSSVAFIRKSTDEVRGVPRPRKSADESALVWNNHLRLSVPVTYSTMLTHTHTHTHTQIIIKQCILYI